MERLSDVGQGEMANRAVNVTGGWIGVIDVEK
jgi:hypothetical protein